LGSNLDERLIWFKAKFQDQRSYLKHICLEMKFHAGKIWPSTVLQRTIVQLK